MGVKINLTIKPKNHAADPKIGFQSHQFQSRAINFKAMPTTWE